jgi:hypothetical protein
MDRQYNDKWGAVNRREGQTIKWQMRSSKSLLLISHCIVCSSLWFTAPHLPLYCLIHLSDLMLLIYHCIVCPSLWFTAPHLSLYFLSISLIYCSSLVIVLSVHLSDLLFSFAIVLSNHLSDLLLLICHCIVCPSVRFTAPHLPLYCLSLNEEQ